MEYAARAALDTLRGQGQDEPEWVRARTKLMEFAAILRRWDRKAKNTEPELGNVDAICQRET